MSGREGSGMFQGTIRIVVCCLKAPWAQLARSRRGAVQNQEHQSNTLQLTQLPLCYAVFTYKGARAAPNTHTQLGSEAKSPVTAGLSGNNSQLCVKAAQW